MPLRGIITNDSEDVGEVSSCIVEIVAEIIFKVGELIPFWNNNGNRQHILYGSRDGLRHREGKVKVIDMVGVRGNFLELQVVQYDRNCY